MGEESELAALKEHAGGLKKNEIIKELNKDRWIESNRR
jgi:hypothetical protein